MLARLQGEEACVYKCKYVIGMHLQLEYLKKQPSLLSLVYRIKPRIFDANLASFVMNLICVIGFWDREMWCTQAFSTGAIQMECSRLVT